MKKVKASKSIRTAEPEKGNVDEDRGKDEQEAPAEDYYTQGSILKESEIQYKKSLRRIAREYQDTDDIDKIRLLLRYQRIKCFKYNSDLDPGSTATCFYESTIHLSKDETEIIIMNRDLIEERVYGQGDDGPVDKENAEWLKREALNQRKSIKNERRRIDIKGVFLSNQVRLD